MTDTIVKETNLKTLKLFKKGKVRDIYDLDDYLLIVTTDRISAFDFILPNVIPFKGKVLTQMSVYWFKIVESIVPNHIVSFDVNEFPESCKPYSDILKDRSMLVKKAEPLPVECIVRGYISGSMWDEYKSRVSEIESKDEKSTVQIYGEDLPINLMESGKFKTPIFTPATKAEQGGHDENISFETAKGILGNEVAKKVKDISIKIYNTASDIVCKSGIIIADTKFEFGMRDGKLILIDEICSPDSSRFWPIQEYKPGRSQPSFDKQFVRDYLLSLNWDRVSPPPALSEKIITQTSNKYLQAFEILTGKSRSELM